MNGIQAAASALDGYQRRQEAIAHNLANANTVGFKRILVTLSSSRPDGGPGATEAPPVVQVREGVDFRQGDLVRTGAPLDLALDGEGLFAVETPAGERYTRAGNFQRNAEGLLVTPSGHPVLGEGGSPIRLGDGALDEVRVDSSGRVAAPGGSVRLRLVKFPPATLLPAGEGLFRPRAGASPEPAEVAVRQGYRERSNANPIDELLGLIEVQRSFEAAQRSVQAALRTLERTSDLV
ncbi:MAG: flagellar hook basal-body protein [Planctomycetota bacterium]|nr:MAG: flagellar hook basal-body protein [Planctomycetota bacterium]